jgi:hypothetical protein
VRTKNCKEINEEFANLLLEHIIYNSDKYNDSDFKNKRK